MKKGFLKSLSDSKNVKYTSINIAFCAIVIAIVMVLNGMVTIFSGKYKWQLDMTDEGLFTMSEQMETAVKELFDKRDVEIEIIFAKDKDEISDKFEISSTSGAIGYVHATAEQLSIKFPDNVTLSYHDIEEEYTFFKNNFYSDSGTSLSQNVIIIARKNADGTYGEYRVFHYNAFYGSDSSGGLYAYNGEMLFTSSILGLALDESPTVYFTWQHNETSFKSWTDESKPIDYLTIETSKDINTDARELIRIFAQSGFEVRPIDLATQEIPDNARCIVINKPKYDFTEAETKKLVDYFKDSGTIFCFTEYNIDLPNLYECAEANFGVTVKPLGISENPIKDPATVLANSTPYTIRAYVPNNTAANNYFRTLKDVASAKAIIENANVIDIDERYLSDSGYQEGEFGKFVKPILVTSETAELNGKKGVYNLVTVTAAAETDVNGSYNGITKEKYSYFLMCPNDGFTSNQNLLSSANANRDMMMALVHTLAAKEDTPSLVDIDFKVFVNYSLDITAREANIVTVVMATVLPLAFVIAGAVIIRRRKLR